MPTKCDECNSKDCPGRTNETSSLKYTDHNQATCPELCKEGFVCTRPSGHLGSHEAAGIADNQYAIWD